MGKGLQDVIGVFRAAALRFSAEGATFLAQALAFNALFAAIPLSLVVIAMFGYIYGTEEGNARALEAIDQFAPQIYGLVASNLESVVRYRGVSGIVGLIGLVWSGKNVFGATSYALDRSLGIPSRHFVFEIIVALVLVPLLGIALLVTTAVPVVISYIGRYTGLEYLRYAPQIESYAASLIFVFVFATLVYTYLPNRRADPRFGVPGAILTALGYTLAQVAFAIYTAHTNFLQIYGTLSAIFAFMLWVYYICVIFLYGAYFSAQWELRFSPRAPDARAAIPATPA